MKKFISISFLKRPNRIAQLYCWLHLKEGVPYGGNWWRSKFTILCVIVDICFFLGEDLFFFSSFCRPYFLFWGNLIICLKSCLVGICVASVVREAGLLKIAILAILMLVFFLSRYFFFAGNDPVWMHFFLGVSFLIKSLPCKRNEGFFVKYSHLAFDIFFHRDRIRGRHRFQVVHWSFSPLKILRALWHIFWL